MTEIKTHVMPVVSASDEMGTAEVMNQDPPAPVNKFGSVRSALDDHGGVGRGELGSDAENSGLLPTVVWTGEEDAALSISDSGVISLVDVTGLDLAPDSVSKPTMSMPSTADVREVFDGGRCQVVQTDTPPTLVLEYDGNDDEPRQELVPPCPSTSPWRGEASVEIEFGSMKSTAPATALKLFGVAAIALATYWTVPMLSFLWPW